MTKLLLSDWRVLARRWYVVLIGLPITFALCWLVTTLVPVQYNLTATVLLLPPRTLVDGKPINPYLNLGGLDGISDVLSNSLTDSTVGEAMAGQGVAAEYEVDRDQTVAGPVVVINVKGDSQDDAVRAQDFLMQRLPVVLDRLQSSVGVGKATRITSTTITRDTAPKVNRAGQLRALIVVGALGIGGTYLGTSLLDGILMRRRKPPAGTARSLETSQRTPNLEQPAPLRQTPPPLQQPEPARPQTAHPQPTRPQTAHPQPTRPQTAHPPPTQPNPTKRPLAGQRSDPWPL